MKLRTKLIVFGLVMAVLTAAVGGFGLLNMIRTDAEMQKVYKANMAGSQYLSTIREGYRAVEANIFQMTLYTAESTGRKEIIDYDLLPTLDSIQEAVQAYGELDLSEAEVKLMKMLGQKQESFEERRAWLIEKSGTADAQEMRSLYQVIKPTIQEVLIVADSLQTASEKRGNALYQHSQETRKNAVMATIALVAVAVLFAVGFAFWIIRSVMRPLGQMNEGLSQVEQGNLTVRFKASQTELGRLGLALNTTLEKLGQMMLEAKRSSDAIEMASSSLAHIANQSGTSAQQVSVSIMDVAGRTQESTSSALTIQHLADGTLQATEKGACQVDQTYRGAAQSLTAARDGQEAMTNAEKSMETLSGEMHSASQSILRLEQETGDIDEMIEAITGIANQTNLLALNANIEAARAGEHGRGFAVVADEVRKLADASRQAAEDAQQRIGRVRAETGSVVDTLRASVSAVDGLQDVIRLGSSALENVVRTSEASVEQCQQVSTVFQQIQRNAEQTVEAVAHLNGLMQETSATTEEVAAASEEQAQLIVQVDGAAEQLHEMAGVLEQAIVRFTVEAIGEAEYQQEPMEAMAAPEGNVEDQQAVDEQVVEVIECSKSTG